jgi:hypothetical protein
MRRRLGAGADALLALLLALLSALMLDWFWVSVFILVLG